MSAIVRPWHPPYVSSDVDRAGLTPVEFRVLGHVAATSVFGWCWLSHVRIGRRTGLAPRKVARALRTLFQRNLIEQKPRHRQCIAFPEHCSMRQLRPLVGPRRRKWRMRLALMTPSLIAVPLEIEAAQVSTAEYRVFFHAVSCNSSGAGCRCPTDKMCESLGLHRLEVKGAIEWLTANRWIKRDHRNSLVTCFRP